MFYIKSSTVLGSVVVTETIEYYSNKSAKPGLLLDVSKRRVSDLDITGSRPRPPKTYTLCAVVLCANLNKLNLL